LWGCAADEAEGSVAEQWREAAEGNNGRGGGKQWEAAEGNNGRGKGKQWEAAEGSNGGRGRREATGGTPTQYSYSSIVPGIADTIGGIADTTLIAP